MVSTLLYNSILFFHIFSVIIWFWTIPVYMIIDRVLPNVVEEKKFSVLKLARINGLFSMIAVIGIFLTGSMMTEFHDWGWFPFKTYAWLATKQVIFFGIVIAGTYFLKMTEKAMVAAMEANEPMETVHAIYKKLVTRTHMLTGFVLINVILATTKLF